ncbi:MAG: EAL domain-containing protein [Pseudomonadota bacterium]
MAKRVATIGTPVQHKQSLPLQSKNLFGKDALVIVAIGLVALAFAVGLYKQAGISFVLAATIGATGFFVLFALHYLIVQVSASDSLVPRINSLERVVANIARDIGQLDDLSREMGGFRSTCERIEALHSQLQLGGYGEALQARDELGQVLSQEISRLETQMQKMQMEFAHLNEQNRVKLKSELGMIESLIRQMSSHGYIPQTHFSQTHFPQARSDQPFLETGPGRSHGGLPHAIAGPNLPKRLMPPTEAWETSHGNTPLSQQSHHVAKDDLTRENANIKNTESHEFPALLNKDSHKSSMQLNTSFDQSFQGGKELLPTLPSLNNLESPSFSGGSLAPETGALPYIEQISGASAGSLNAFSPKSELNQIDMDQSLDATLKPDHFSQPGEAFSMASGLSHGHNAGGGEVHDFTLPRPQALDQSMLQVIRNALANNRVELFLQPVVKLPQRDVAYYEAFTRLRGVTGELIQPTEYVQQAEHAGFISAIDNIMLYRSVQVTRKLNERGSPRSVFCNISHQSILDPEFFSEFLSFMDQNKALSKTLSFDFSQDMIKNCSSIEFESLQSLSRLGYKFCLDKISDLDIDFADLEKKGFAYIRVDADILLNGMTKANARIHAADMKSYLQRFNIELIVEKIENENMLAQLSRFGITLGQGYLFSEPRPVRPEVFSK